MRPTAFWLAVVPCLFVAGVAVSRYEEDPCSRSGTIVTCDTRADAAQSGAAEARTKGLAGACVEPVSRLDSRYSVSLTATDCAYGREFVAAEVAP